MKVLKTPLEEVLIVEPQVFSDSRGFFMETYHKDRYERNGMDAVFVQDNFSCSVQGTLRGLHYQFPNAQKKLVQVLKGEVFDVAVDIRKGSPAFGKWTGVILSETNRRQLFIPEGFAHGFAVLSSEAIFSYKCSDFYTPHSEKGIVWNDPDLDIEWPIAAPILSEKDTKYPCLQDVNPKDLPSYGGVQ
ncbi:MAG: dTDP-4-dehydrorhamnose 3,5-epimerase [Desulfobacterales bacterium]